jgi:hypothetical protein
MKTKSTWTNKQWAEKVFNRNDIMQKFNDLQEAMRRVEYDQDELDERLNHAYVQIKKEDIDSDIKVDVDPSKIWVKSDDEEEEYTLNEKLDMVLDELANLRESMACIHVDIDRIEEAIKLHGR